MTVQRVSEDFSHDCKRPVTKHEVYGWRPQGGKVIWKAKAFDHEIIVSFCPYCGLDLERATEEGASE